MADYYRILHPATGKVVNLYSTSTSIPAKKGDKLLLYSWQNNSDQKFELNYYNNGPVYMRLERDRSLVINRNSNDNSAHVWTWDINSAATRKDSLIDTETRDGNTRLKLVEHTNPVRYLTKNSSNDYLTWSTKVESNRQYFKLEKVDPSTGGGTNPGSGGTGGFSGSRHSSATIKVSAQNQYGYPYTNYSSKFQSNACYIASLVSAAVGLGRSASVAKAIEEGAVKDYWVGDNQPGYVYFDPSFITIARDKTYSLANIYTQLKTYGRPVIVYGANSTSGHFVVAYYTSATSSSGCTTNNTYVMDPWQGWVTLQTFLNVYPNSKHLRYCS